MEISYNLAINELKQRKMALEKETSDLIIEKDKVLEEIRKQREATGAVYHEQLSLSNLRYFLDEQTKILSDIRSKSFDNFSVDYSKHKTILEEIGKSIEQGKKMMDEFKISKEDIEKLKIKKQGLEIEIKEKNNELWEVINKIDYTQTKVDEDIKRNQKILAKIEEEKEFVRLEKESMKQFEADLKLMEKRLNNLKLSLKK